MHLRICKLHTMLCMLLDGSVQGITPGMVLSACFYTSCCALERSPRGQLCLPCFFSLLHGIVYIPFLLTGIRFVSSVFSVTLDWVGISEWTSEAQGIHALDFTRDGKNYVPPVHTCPVVSDHPVFPWMSPPVVCSDFKRLASLLCVKWRLAVLVLISGCPMRLTVSSRA